MGLLNVEIARVGGGDVILVDVFSNKLREPKKKLVSTNTCNPFNFSFDEAQELTDEVENILA